ncbi:phosphohydrolase [Enterococcus sp. AD013-P3]|uniref:phosphohydrolase n=1 Tax=Enterococcus sp. AD013-P3 TaxID=3411036 RepID=UPI003B957436
MISASLKNYMESEIIPRYDQLDTSHASPHVHQVIANSFEILAELNLPDVDPQMCYVVAAYHDLGLLFGRENHETRSKELLMADQKLAQWFSLEQLTVMGEAVEDHRASLSLAPRSLYGKVISEADRDIDFERILYRTFVYGIEKKGLRFLPELTEEAATYMTEKYGPNSNLKFWLSYSKNQQQLERLHRFLADEKSFARACHQTYAAIFNPGQELADGYSITIR